MATRSLNKVMLIGNLTRDPELKYTAQGTAICTFGLATNRSWTTEDGEKKENATFHRIVAWDKLAEICEQILYKGRKTYLEGRLNNREWEGDDGETRRVTEIVISEMIAFGAPNPNRSTSTGQPQASQTNQNNKPKPKPTTEEKASSSEEEEIKAEDIPF